MPPTNSYHTEGKQQLKKKKIERKGFFFPINETSMRNALSLEVLKQYMSDEIFD